MSYLTVPNALNDKKQVKGGLHALCMFVNHASEEVDKDPQLQQVYALINRASNILLKDFHMPEKALHKLGWRKEGMQRATTKGGKSGEGS